jgi:hypothetical protein
MLSSTIQSQLKDFVSYLSTHFDQLTQAEKLILFQAYTKHNLLKNQQTVKDDDWDYISLGIFLKESLQSSSV